MELKTQVQGLAQLIADTRTSRRSRSKSAASGDSRVSNLSLLSSVSNRIRLPSPQPPEKRPRNDIIQDQPEGGIAPLDEDVLEFIGSSRKTETKYGEALHVELASRWNQQSSAGLEEDEAKSIVEQFPVPENCKLVAPPKLNAEVEAVSSEYCLERDRKLQIFQLNIASSITALGGLISRAISNTEETLDKKTTVNGMCAAAKILLHTQYSLSSYRKRLITPKQGVLCKVAPVTSIDCFLFGDDLKDKVKAAEDIAKVGQSMIRSSKVTKPHSSGQTKSKTKASVGTSKRLNYNRPPTRQNQQTKYSYRRELSGRSRSRYHRN